MDGSGDMPADVYSWIAVADWTMGSIGRYAIGDAEVFGVEPAHFPQPVVRAPEGAKAFCAFAQIVLLVADADRDHFLVAPAGSPAAEGLGNGFDDQFHGFAAAGFVPS